MPLCHQLTTATTLYSPLPCSLPPIIFGYTVILPHVLHIVQYFFTQPHLALVSSVTQSPPNNSWLHGHTALCNTYSPVSITMPPPVSPQ
jgi:hypothetical protein